MKYPQNQSKNISFTFGDPEPIIGGRMLSATLTVSDTGTYFLPPCDLLTLAKLRKANPYHGSAIVFRRNMLCNALVRSGLRRSHFAAAAMDFYTFGFATLQQVKNRAGQLLELRHVPALQVRPAINGGYIYLKSDLEGNVTEVPFFDDEILCVKEYDPEQSVFGIPDWLGGMQSALLGEDATLFRRKYFKNGCHLGYVFYSSDASLRPEDEDKFKRAIESGKGVGNFKTMYVHIPNGKEKSLQVIPVGDISQKDEFEKIKRLSAEDVCAAHRVPPALMGIAPQNAGGFGAIDKITEMYFLTEVKSATLPWEDLNHFLPQNLQFIFNTNIKREEK